VVNAGVTLLFGEGGVLLCQGRVSVEGTPDRRVLLQSLDAKRGNGLLIKGQRNSTPVEIRYTQFLGLSSALRFEQSWTRSSVLISDCEFINNTSSTPVIAVMSPRFEAGVDNPVISFDLHGSLFTQNGASVYFEDMVANNLSIRVTSNVFVNNRLADYGVYNYSGNVLYGRADKRDPSFSATLEANTFLQNYLVSIVSDTIVQRTSVGVFGTADSIRARDNFWGTTKLTAIRKGVYDFYTNYTSPGLLIEPFLSTPSFSAPPHIFSICADDGTAGSFFSICDLLDERFLLANVSGLTLQANSNKPLLNESAQLLHTWLDDSLQQQTRVLNATFKRGNDELVQLIVLDSLDRELFINRPGFLKLEGFRGVNNETVPSLMIGYESYLQSVYAMRKKTNESIAELDSTITRSSESDVKLSTVNTPIVTTTTKTRFYLVAGSNISHQQITDSRPLQTLIFPIEDINSSFLQPGFSVGIRWDRSIHRSLSSSVTIGYSFIRPSRQLQQLSDSILPFGTRFASFMPRQSFRLVGLQAGLRATVFSSLSVNAGGAIDYNMLQKTSIDKETPSYKSYVHSFYAGLEVALPAGHQIAPVVVGIKWRRWFSTIALKNVSNTIDMAELFTAVSLWRASSDRKKEKK
jgi:hypothetical protein